MQRRLVNFCFKAWLLFDKLPAGALSREWSSRRVAETVCVWPLCVQQGASKLFAMTNYVQTVEPTMVADFKTEVTCAPRVKAYLVTQGTHHALRLA